MIASACEKCELIFIKNVKLLIDGGADINLETEIGCTALLFAIEKKNFKIAKYLIKMGADVNKYDWKNNEYPLLLTMYYGKKRLAKMMIELGADINIKDNHNKTPMNYAHEGHMKELIPLLIDRDAKYEFSIPVDEYYHQKVLKRELEKQRKELVEEMYAYGGVGYQTLKDKWENNIE